MSKATLNRAITRNIIGSFSGTDRLRKVNAKQDITLQKTQKGGLIRITKRIKRNPRWSDAQKAQADKYINADMVARQLENTAYELVYAKYREWKNKTKQNIGLHAFLIKMKLDGEL